MSPIESYDPFIVVGEIPAGLAYQWCPIRIMRDYKLAQPILSALDKGGWAPVPWERHPEMARDRQWIVVQDQLLMQKPLRLVKKAQHRLRQMALDQAVQHREHEAPPTFISPAPVSGLSKMSFKEVKESLPVFRGQSYAVFSVSLGLTLDDREIDTAIALSLEPAEYARRKFLMRSYILQRRSDLDNGTTTPIFDFINLKPESES